MTTECNFVCSSKQENPQVHCAGTLSIHTCIVLNTACMLDSPDDIFMALVSIFISKTHNHFWSTICFGKDTCHPSTNNILMFLFKCARKMTRKVRINKITAFISRITVLAMHYTC